VTINGADPVQGQDPMERLNDEVTGLSRQMGEFLRVQGRLDARQDRFEARLDRVETDIATLKAGDEVSLRELSQLESLFERRFNRIDAQLERLIGLVQRAEAG
jgi:hypothetical protein